MLNFFKLLSLFKAGKYMDEDTLGTDLITHCERELKIAFISNSMLPTLQISFLKPLREISGENALSNVMCLTEQDLVRDHGKILFRSVEIGSLLVKKISLFDPDIIVFCRYSGPHADRIIDFSRSKKIATVFHIDDDLLNIPKDIGIKKYEYHNNPSRLATIRYLLNSCNLIYFSTNRLASKLSSEIPYKKCVVVGGIYCSNQILNYAVKRPFKKLGYMGGGDHFGDFITILPAIFQIMDKHSHIELEMFCSFKVPELASKYKGRIRYIEPINNYDEFLLELSKRHWDAGICCLNPISFNQMKADTKWVEYTACGTAVIASADTAYDDCCKNECGILVKNIDQWVEALDHIITDSAYRHQITINAQKKLDKMYNPSILQKQVINVFRQAINIVK